MCICLFNICFFGYLGQFWVSLLFFVVFVIKDAYDTDFDKLERYVYADGQEISMLTELEAKPVFYGVSKPKYQF